MLATLGDLIEDVAVRVSEPLNVASDTASVITRRRGGSAANVAETAARLGHPSRFIGQVGADPIGDALIADLASSGVDVDHVSRLGTTGTIIVLVDATGERTMLTDRRTCADLADPRPEWLTGATTLHVPLYSLIGGVTAETAATMIDWAHERELPVSIDLSSTALMNEVGVGAVRHLVERLRPSVVFANADEADLLGIDATVGDALTIVKNGAAPASIYRVGAAPVRVPVLQLGEVPDSTGAGDAFAAGFLTFRGWRDDAPEACRAGHAAARAALLLRH